MVEEKLFGNGAASLFDSGGTRSAPGSAARDRANSGGGLLRSREDSCTSRKSDGNLEGSNSRRGPVSPTGHAHTQTGTHLAELLTLQIPARRGAHLATARRRFEDHAPGGADQRAAQAEAVAGRAASNPDAEAQGWAWNGRKGPRAKAELREFPSMRLLFSHNSRVEDLVTVAQLAGDAARETPLVPSEARDNALLPRQARLDSRSSDSETVTQQPHSSRPLVSLAAPSDGSNSVCMPRRVSS